MKEVKGFGTIDKDRDDTGLAGPSEYKVSSKLFLLLLSPTRNVSLELWQPGTDEAHPSKGQVADLTDGTGRRLPS